jgi:hypothetical protein
MKYVQILFIFILLTSVSIFCQNIGKSIEFNKGQIIYKNTSDLEIVRKLGEYLVKTEFFDGTPNSIQYISENNKHIIKMITDDSLLTVKPYLDQVKYFTYELSENIFNYEIVDFYLTNQYFETKLIIDGFVIGKKMNFGKNDLYYNKSISAEKANEFGTYLSKIGFFGEDGKVVRIYDELGIFHIAFPILEGYDKKYDYILLVYTFIRQVSDEFVEKKKVMIHLTDSHFNDLRVISSF